MVKRAKRMLEEGDEIASGSYTDAFDDDEGEIDVLPTRGLETAETSSSLTASTHALAGKHDTISWQTFQEQEEKWHQRYEDIVVKLDAEFAQRSEKMEAKFAKRVEKINRKIKEQALENERIVIHARLINKIESHFTEGVQTGLDELARTAEFQELLAKEIKAGHVAKEDVDRCIAVVYRESPECEQGNSSLITIHEEDYTANERAALATFLGVQGGWAHGLKWREAKRA
ncbi:hypothetical protein HOY82DRAFT_541553 [Tuber indicum]|nr:hypothetical protein HOY82DRAFT_541553 [Tuber indicum]